MNWFKMMFGRKASARPGVPVVDPHQVLIGRVARAITPLRTSGVIELDGTRYEVVSNKGYVPADTYVRITGKRMGWLVVEPANPVE